VSTFYFCLIAFVSVELNNSKIKYDYLVESQNGERFMLVPREDPEEGLLKAVTSEKIREVVSRINLDGSFLSQYMDLLSTTQSVDKDLLIEEGATIDKELDAVYEHLKRIVLDEDGSEDDTAMIGEVLPEGEVAWWALKSWYGVYIVDRDGHTDIFTNPFKYERSPACQSAPNCTPTAHRYRRCRRSRASC
jgi:hypothetical protein